jgi:peptide/nickel transport system substrate-binding protein
MARITSLASGALSRRTFLRMSVLAGVSAGLAAACSPATPATPTPLAAAAPTSAAAAPKPTTAPAAAQPTTATAAAPTTAPAAAQPTTATTSAAPTTASAAAPATGEATLVLGVDAETLDPHVTTNAFSLSIMKTIFDTLVFFDTNFAPQPGLAESWDTPTDTTWRFKLRQGVKFHDGSPFNAEAAKFSLDRYVDPATKNPQAGVLKPVTSVKVVDASTIELTTDGPYPALLNALWNAAFMMSPSAVSAAGADVAKKPVGTGQYKFVEWVPGERLVVEANPDYWGTRAKIQKLTWKPIPEASTRIVALRTGQGDLIANVPPQLTNQIEGQADLKLQRVPGSVITIMFNFDMPPFDNIKVRQALNYAVNVDEIIQFVLAGSGTRLASATRPGMLGHDPDLKPYPYDPAKAKQLLTEAGFPNGFEATLDAPNGRYLNDKAVAEALVGQLNKVGLNITLNMPDYNTLVQKIVGHTSQFYLIGNVEPATEISFPRSFQKGGAFYQGYNNPEVNDLIDKANRTLARDARGQLFLQANRLVQQDAPWIFLYAQQDIYGMRNRLQGFEVRPDAYIIVRDWSLAS